MFWNIYGGIKCFLSLSLSLVLHIQLYSASFLVFINYGSEKGKKTENIRRRMSKDNVKNKPNIVCNANDP